MTEAELADRVVILSRCLRALGEEGSQRKRSVIPAHVASVPSLFPGAITTVRALAAVERFGGRPPIATRDRVNGPPPGAQRTGSPSVPLIQMRSTHQAAVAPLRRWRRNAQRHFDALRGERFAQTFLIRTIFGNPFRPLAFAPECAPTPSVQHLALRCTVARVLRDGRSWADALQTPGTTAPTSSTMPLLGRPARSRVWVVDLCWASQ